MKIRIKFSKQGYMKFVGHLDIMRYFQKAMRRANVNIRYSEGFSPHQIMSFAAPLGVGITSNGEYLDIEVTDSGIMEKAKETRAAGSRAESDFNAKIGQSAESAPYSESSRDGESSVEIDGHAEAVSSKDMTDRLNQVMVEEIRILSYRRLPDSSKNAMSIVCAADYTLKFREGYEPEDMEAFFERLEKFFGQEQIIITKKTKRSQKEMDLKPLIYRLERRGDAIFMEVSTGSMDNVKPELVMESFYQAQQWEYPKFAFRIQREEVYGQDGTGNMIPLEEFGEDIE